MTGRWSLVACVAICLTLPWYVLRFHLGPLPTTLLEIVILVGVTLWLAEHLIERSAIIWPSVLWRWCVLLILLASVSSLFVAPSWISALGVFRAYVVEPLLVYFMFVDVLKSADHRRVIVFSLLLSSLPLGFFALTQALVHWPNFASQELAQGRSSGLFNSANALALYMGPVLVLSYSFLRYSDGKRVMLQKLITFFTLASSVASLYLSHSRGAIMGILATILIGGGVRFLLARIRDTKRWWRMGVVGGVVLYMVVVAAYIGVFNHPPKVANPYTRPNFTTFTIRQCVWQGTASILHASPLWGLGMTGFAKKYPSYATCDAEPLVYPHNHLLNIWVEWGLVGVLGMFILVAVCLDQLCLDTDSEDWLRIGLSLVFIYWLGHGLIDVPYFKNDLSVFWWIVVALCTNVSSSKLTKNL